MTAALARLFRDRPWPVQATKTLFAGVQQRTRTVLRPVSATAPGERPAASAEPGAPALAPLPGSAQAAAGISPGRRASDLTAHQAADDWDLLLAAVTARLRGCLALPGEPAPDANATVAECLQALDRLQTMRVGLRGGERRLEGELQRCSGALAAARSDLVQARLGERRASHLAQHDSLTSLPNRSSFSARLESALRRGDQPALALAVLFLDLDGFKPINDRHGHDTGDELLRIVASRLSRSLRAQDMVCRLGGDEFACLLSAPMGREQLSQIAAKLFDAVSAPLQVGPLQLVVRPSIGIAQCPDDGDDARTLLKRADSAMYRAKRRQLGFAFFDRAADS